MAPDPDPNNWEQKTDLATLIGVSVGNSGSFHVDDAPYGKSDGGYWVAVDYDEVARNADPDTMMQSRWIGGSAWHLQADDGFVSTRSVLTYPRYQGGRWALLEVIEGG